MSVLSIMIRPAHSAAGKGNARQEGRVGQRPVHITGFLRRRHDPHKQCSSRQRSHPCHQTNANSRHMSKRKGTSPLTPSYIRALRANARQRTNQLHSRHGTADKKSPTGRQRRIERGSHLSLSPKRAKRTFVSSELSDGAAYLTSHGISDGAKRRDSSC